MGCYLLPSCELEHSTRYCDVFHLGSFSSDQGHPVSQTSSLIVQESGQKQKLRLSPPKNMISSRSALDIDILCEVTIQ